ncbi:hypothetical protein DKM44_14340 [Deinococcus irradiatisoli]|uniref:Uncharacterized protein n=1 Tax=Deinococcus irradiatisoli TaxID=2202254 RepID=A0A2Z3JM70_9DEIO|nr:hypothetical protein [Deinococcus irradiatisoli]AWN24260.1 hypothetical protein DKM44_14340 [Deinococcus irradiatisoli]
MLLAELDALYFYLYGIGRSDIDFIMETFPIAKRKDEVQYRTYRTKYVILEIHGEIAHLDLGDDYRASPKTRPADDRVAHRVGARA